MRILAIVDPPHTLRPLGDSTIAILDEIMRRGHSVWLCEPHALWIREGKAGADVHAVSEVRRDRPPALTWEAQPTAQPLQFFHAVLMRKDPPYDSTYHLATLILEHARGQTLLVNDPRGLREANEKLYIFHFPDLIAPTIVTHRMDEVRAFLQQQNGEIVVKPLDGHGGSSVFYLRSDDRNIPTILEVMTKNGRNWVMAQRYLDVSRTGDKRILLLDGEPIGSFVRMPQTGELRSNMVVGGQAMACEMTDQDRHICERLKPRLQKDGLHFVGIDIIEGYLTEVNVTSPTGVQAVDRLYNVRVENQIVDFLEQHAPRSV